MNLELAANILAKGKKLAPDRFPQADREVAQAWAEALGVVDFPPRLWAEAVTLWATRLAGDRMVTPRDLLSAAYSVRDRWEGDPERAQILEALRVERANRNYAQWGLEPIEAADLPQNTPRATGPGRGRQGGMRRLGESLPDGR